MGRPERGVGSLEYIGILVAAAIVVGSITFTLGGQSGARIQQAVCEAVGRILDTGGQCSGSGDQGDGDPTAGDADETLTDEEFEPDKCRVSETGESYNSVVRIAFFEFGDNAGLTVTEYSDGTVRVTATDGGSLGLTGGFGADATIGDVIEAGAKIDFGFGVKFSHGDTWVFDSVEEADRMRKDLDEYLVQQAILRGPHPGGMPPIIFNLKSPPKPPTERVVSIGVAGDAGITFGINPKLGGGTDMAGNKAESLNIPAARIAAGVDGGATWVTRVNDVTGETTSTTELDYSLGHSGRIGTSPFGDKDSASGAMSVTTDANGKIVGITFVSTVEGVLSTSGTAGDGSYDGGTSDGKDRGSGGGSISDTDTTSRSTVVTTSLRLDPTAPGYQDDLRVVEDWLAGNGQFSTPGAISNGALNPTSLVPGDSFQNLLYNNAKVSSVVYDNVTDQFTFGLNVKLGVALGVDFSLTNTESNAVQADYLGAPIQGADRPWVPYTTCVQ